MLYWAQEQHHHFITKGGIGGWGEAGSKCYNQHLIYPCKFLYRAWLHIFITRWLQLKLSNQGDSILASLLSWAQVISLCKTSHISPDVTWGETVRNQNNVYGRRGGAREETKPTRHQKTPNTPKQTLVIAKIFKDKRQRTRSRISKSSKPNKPTILNCNYARF